MQEVIVTDVRLISGICTFVLLTIFCAKAYRKSQNLCRLNRNERGLGDLYHMIYPAVDDNDVSTVRWLRRHWLGKLKNFAKAPSCLVRSAHFQLSNSKQWKNFKKRVDRWLDDNVYSFQFVILYSCSKDTCIDLFHTDSTKRHPEQILDKKCVIWSSKCCKSSCTNWVLYSKLFNF